MAHAESLISRRSHLLVNSARIRAAHDVSAVATATKRAKAGERQGRHFVTLVAVGERLVLCDGRRLRPIDCGRTSARGFVRDAVALVGSVMVAASAEDEEHKQARATTAAGTHEERAHEPQVFSLLALAHMGDVDCG